MSQRSKIWCFPVQEVDSARNTASGVGLPDAARTATAVARALSQRARTTVLFSRTTSTVRAVVAKTSTVMTTRSHVGTLQGWGAGDSFSGVMAGMISSRACRPRQPYREAHAHCTLANPVGTTLSGAGPGRWTVQAPQNGLRRGTGRRSTHLGGRPRTEHGGRLRHITTGLRCPTAPRGVPRLVDVKPVDLLGDARGLGCQVSPGLFGLAGDGQVKYVLGLHLVEL